jgi:hypothetical protein
MAIVTVPSEVIRTPSRVAASGWSGPSHQTEWCLPRVHDRNLWPALLRLRSEFRCSLWRQKHRAEGVSGSRGAKPVFPSPSGIWRWAASTG